jgi:uracil-DNA glycosylase
MIPAIFLDALKQASPSWQPVLAQGLAAVDLADPAYLPALESEHFLPTQGRLFAAFAQPLDDVRYVLVGEGPYPREESATGVCFMDGAVAALWSAQGLSKPVNRATSLRNFMKMLMVAEGLLEPGATGAEAVSHVAAKALAPASGFIQTLPELQANLTAHGFLLLNAALVFRPHVPPLKEAKAWQPLLQVVLHALAQSSVAAHRPLPTLVLWGKIAQWFNDLPAVSTFPKAVAEHPYNLSFILNQDMQRLFGPMHLLAKA